MARSRFCKTCSGWHDLAQPWPVECLGHFGIKADAPYVRTDGMDPIRSMADGRLYDSKSAYYASVKRAGCEIIGNDTGGSPPRPGYQAGHVEVDIKRAIAELNSGR